MIPELIIVALLLGWMLGGKPGRLADAPIKWIWLLAVPVALYFIAFGISRTPSLAVKFAWSYGAFHIAAKAVLLVFVYANRRIPGAKIVLVGMVLNFIAIVANGGLMPADPSSVVTAFGPEKYEQIVKEPHFQSSIGGNDYNVKILCDFIPSNRLFLLIPGVYSIGDMFISLGIVIAMISIIRTPLLKETPAAQEA